MVVAGAGGGSVSKANPRLEMNEKPTVQPHGEEYAIMRGEEVLALFGSHAEALRNLEVLKQRKGAR